MDSGRADAWTARRLRRRHVCAPAAAGLALGLALLAVACAPARPLPTANVVRVGAALALTGTAKPFGTAQRSGIRLAQDEINARHVLGNTHLEVVVEDDGSDRDQASGAFQRLIESDHVVAIMGPTLSDTALSVDPLAQQAGVPVLAISNAAG